MAVITGAGSGMAKASAVVGLTKVGAAESGLANIQVNCVCPGFIRAGIMGAQGIQSNPGLEAKPCLGGADD